MNETPSLRRDEARRGGFTLIEVVIALAIFVFGALAIIRIFPPALGVIQNSGDRLTGTNLNRSLQATYDKQTAPDGTFDLPAEGVAGNWNNGTLGSVAGTRFNNSLPYANITDYDKSALGHFKNIAAERHIVTDSKVILTKFPFSTAAVYVEDTLTGVFVDNAGKLDFTKAVRVSNGATYPIPTTTSTDMIYVSYRWVENGRFWNTDGERINLSVANPSVAQSVRTPTSKVVPDEVTVRVRTLINPAPTSVNGDLGRIVLDSSAAVGTQISIDYEVKDWRWLVYDGYPSSSLETPPTPTTRAVTLPVRVLDTDQPNYLFTVSPVESSISPPTPTPTPVIHNSADYSDPSVAKTSQIPFDPGTNPLPTVRVTYRTADNWAQQVSVAASNYSLSYGSASLEPWRDCAISTTGGYIYFHPSEAGKTVQLTYSYGGTSAATDKQITSRILTIDQDTISPVPSDVPSGFAGSDGRVARLQLTDVQGGNLGTPPTSIQRIKGVSIQSRTAWLDGDRFTQVSSTSFRGGNDQ